MKSTIFGFLAVGIWFYVWGSLAKAAWVEVRDGHVHPMKALAATIIYGPIAGGLATAVFVFVWDAIFGT